MALLAIDLTVKRAVEDNYQKIRRDIQSIFEAHGITDDGEEGDAGQSQPAKNTDGDRPEEKPSTDGNAGEEKEVDDGIHEEEAPDDGGGEQVEDETYIE